MCSKLADEVLTRKHLQVLCVLGGSLGAEAINNAMLLSSRQLLTSYPKLMILWQPVRDRYDMSEACLCSY